MKKQLFGVVACFSLAAAWAASGPKLNIVTGQDVELSVFREGAQLFSNRPYRAPKLPSLLDGQSLVVAPIDGFQIDCLTDGRLYALAPEVPYRKDTKVGEALVKQGFERVADVPVFQLFGKNPWERVVTYRKDVRAGEHLNVAKWAVFFGADAVERSEADSRQMIRSSLGLSKEEFAEKLRENSRKIFADWKQLSVRLLQEFKANVGIRYERQPTPDTPTEY